MRLLACAAIAISVLATTPALAQGEQSKTEADLKRMTTELLDAIAPGNVKVWSGYTHDRLIFVTENNEVMSKKQLLDDLKPLPKGLVGNLKVTGFKAQVHGGFAVTTYIADEHLDYHGQILENDFRISDVWMRTGDGWRLISSHVNAVLEDPPAIALPRAALCALNGTYRLTPDIVTKVTCTDEGLSSERTGRKAVIMRPEVADVFFQPGQPRTRRIFQRDGRGTVTGFVDRREGLDVRWTKME